MEDIELDVGGTKFKGVWIAILFSFASTIGGGIWTASEFFNRLAAQEEAVQNAEVLAESILGRFEDLKEGTNEDMDDFRVSVEKVEQQLLDNDVASLQGKLAELGTNLKTIMEQQKDLLELREEFAELDKTVASNNIVVENAAKKFADYDSKMDRFQRDLDDVWKGMDALSNPLQ